MTIDEAIARERQVAEKHRNNIVPKERYHNMPWIDKNNEVSMKSAEEHEQLAEWLEELKAYREIGTVEGYKSAIECYTEEYTRRKSNEQYNKAIDDFVQKVKEHQYVLSDVINSKDYGMFTVGIEQIAEQLKAGGMNEYNI